MYQIKRHTKKFDPSSPENMREYSELISNPLCSVVEERKLKQTTKDFDDEGQVIGASTTDYMVISWEERSIL